MGGVVGDITVSDVVISGSGEVYMAAVLIVGLGGAHLSALFVFSVGVVRCWKLQSNGLISFWIEPPICGVRIHSPLSIRNRVGVARGTMLSINSLLAGDWKNFNYMFTFSHH